MTVVIRRADSTFAVAIRPKYDSGTGRPLIGLNASDEPSVLVRVGPLRAIPESFQRSFDMVMLIGNTLQKLITAEVSPKELAGPVGIVQMSGGVAFLGLSAALRFMALIGINLALLNLLPLVITDGGMLLFLLLEAIRGKPLSARHQAIINQVAIVFFVLLFVYVTFNDVLRIPRMLRLSR